MGAAGAAAEEDPEPGLGRGMAGLKSPWARRLGRKGRGAPAEGSEPRSRLLHRGGCSGSCGHRDTGGNGNGNGNGLRGAGSECGGKALAVGEEKHIWSATKCSAVSAFQRLLCMGSVNNSAVAISEAMLISAACSGCWVLRVCCLGSNVWVTFCVTDAGSWTQTFVFSLSDQP